MPINREGMNTLFYNIQCRQGVSVFSLVLGDLLPVGAGFQAADVG